MELTREIYWNVGGGAATLLPMYLLLIVAVALLFLDQEAQGRAALTTRYYMLLSVF